jgi:rhamnosyltransferase
MKFNHDILAVLVLYKTKLFESRTFISLTESLKANEIKLDLVVYDNSPAHDKNSLFEYPNWQITYISDISNGGVSKAYNTGASIAEKRGIKNILFLDQDTDFPKSTIDIYIKTINNYPNYKLFAPMMLSDNVIISPCRFKHMRGSHINSLNTGPNVLNDLSIINCGMCVDIQSFKKNNGYNEKIKLDFSDHDFIRRIKKMVTNDFVVLDLIVQHQLSSETKNTFNADRIRFDYYLSGGKLSSDNKVELLNFSFNALVRALKLTAIHKKAYFIRRLLAK